MMFVGDDVQANFVAVLVFVEYLVVEAGGDLGLTVFVWQAGADGRCGVEDFGSNEGVRVFAMVPEFHVGHGGSSQAAAVECDQAFPMAFGGGLVVAPALREG